MKLIVAIAPDKEQSHVADALKSAGIPFTKVGSTGGFLHLGNTTLFIGVEEAECANVLAIIKKHAQKCEHVMSVAPDSNPMLSIGTINTQPLVTESGGGVAFVVDVEQFIRF
jgi:uncharacterized protein YaaQ